MKMSSIKEIWNQQAASCNNEVVKQRVNEIQKLNCFIGTISFSKAKIFTVEIDSHINVHSNYLQRFIGVEVQILPSVNEKKELTIILLEEELTDIFIVFIEDIINSLLTLEDSEAALLIISNRINYWKKLFGKYTGGLLTPDQQRGLFGELYFLKQLLEYHTNYIKIIEAWQAPAGTNQDFYFNGKAIEVKTSKSNIPSIKISNEYQLDLTGLKQLYIAFFKLNEYPDDENTLLKIIREIKSLLKSNPDLLKEFNLKLECLGITPESEEEYNKTGYIVRDEKFYQVTDEFPKITASTVDDAISRISYEIAPNDCKAFEMPFAIVLKGIIE